MNTSHRGQDFSIWPSQTRSDVQIFSANTLNLNWQSWQKPRGATMAYMLCISGGGGGGGGFTRTAGSAGGGGGSGACSGTGRLVIPIHLLPDTLYVQVGLGGLGGAASGAGAAGTNSFISMGNLATNPSWVLRSGANAPGGGGGGTGAAAGAAGAVPTISTISTIGVFGVYGATVGFVGAAGGGQAGAVGVSVTAWATHCISQGAGGAGCTTTDFAGGGQTATAAMEFAELNFPVTAGALAAGGTAGSGLVGSAGISLLKPFIQTGGAGGGSFNSGAAGGGGRGGIGCGGGGGGAGATGGRGGDGGNGLVAIISW